MAKDEVLSYGTAVMVVGALLFPPVPCCSKSYILSCISRHQISEACRGSFAFHIKIGRASRSSCDTRPLGFPFLVLHKLFDHGVICEGGCRVARFFALHGAGPG